MHVTVDQSRHQGHALGVDFHRAFEEEICITNFLDDAIPNQDGMGRMQLKVSRIENPGISDEDWLHIS